MQAAAELSSVMAHLGNIPQLDPRKDNLTAPLISYSSVAAQIQLIAESHTAGLCAEMGKRLTSIFFEMISKAQPMFDLKLEAEMHESLKNFAQREFDQLIGKAKTQNDAGQIDPHQLTELSQSIDQYKERIETHSRAMIDCLDRKLALQKTYLAELMQETKPIVETQIPLMVQLRRELELTSNAAEIAARTETGFTDFQTMINKFLNKPS